MQSGHISIQFICIYFQCLICDEFIDVILFAVHALQLAISMNCNENQLNQQKPLE